MAGYAHMTETLSDAGNKDEELNNKDFRIKLEINNNLRLSNRGLMNKSGSLEGCSPCGPSFGSTHARADGFE